MKYLPLMLLLLLITIGQAMADQGTQTKSGTEALADVWSDRGGEGLNTSCGYYKVGEEAILYFRVSQPMYVELQVIRPDGSVIKLVENSIAGPGVTYKTPKILLVDEGPRTVQLVGGRSHQVLDSCKLYVKEGAVSGDVWTERGGRGSNVTGGSFPPLKPIKVAIRLNATADVELIAITSKGRQVIFRGRLEANRTRYLYLEAVREGMITLRLIHKGDVLDTCKLSISSSEGGPPTIEVRNISISGLTVRLEGEARPGTPNAKLRLEYDWGDGSVEEGAFPISHTYSKEGRYRIRITAKQSDGLSSNFTYTIEVKAPKSNTNTNSNSKSKLEPKLGTSSSGMRTTSRRSSVVSTVTRLVTVTPEEEENKFPSYPILSFSLGSIVTLVAFLTFSRLLERSKRKGEG